MKTSGDGLLLKNGYNQLNILCIILRMASQISYEFVISAIWDARSVMCSVKCMYDLPYEMQYELYSDMLKQLYCGSYSIA